MRDFDVIVVGELNADLIISGDVAPAFGQVEQLVDDAALVLGSSSAIFACGAARLGLRVAFIGKVGDDALGQFVLRELERHGVDPAGVVVDPELKTGLTVILSRAGDRALLTYPGSIAALRCAEIDRELLARGRHMHLGSYFLLDALRPDAPRLFAEARSLGLSVSLDTNYDPLETWDGGLHEALPHVDIFLPNQAELLAITHQADLSAALAALGDTVPTVVVKLGARGARALHAGQFVDTSAIEIAAIDTTGAGDSFDAGFVYGHLAGWTVAESLRMACVCGALSTRAVGGTAAQATLAEARAFL
jgi:sugar/nucleoside kinase (ribokinase family)